jgi:hypothetical protein
MSLKPSWVQIFPSAACSQTPSVYISPNVRDKSSSSYETTGKISALYVLTLMLLDSRQEGKRFCTEWQQTLPEFNLLLHSL